MLVPQEFKAENNQFSGTLPPDYSISNLWWMEFSGNNLTGTIPTSWSAFNGQKPLNIFQVTNNSLVGNLYPLSNAHVASVSAGRVALMRALARAHQVGANHSCALR